MERDCILDLGNKIEEALKNTTSVVESPEVQRFDVLYCIDIWNNHPYNFLSV